MLHLIVNSFLKLRLYSIVEQLVLTNFPIQLLTFINY